MSSEHRQDMTNGKENRKKERLVIQTLFIITFNSLCLFMIIIITWANYVTNIKRTLQRFSLFANIVGVSIFKSTFWDITWLYFICLRRYNILNHTLTHQILYSSWSIYHAFTFLVVIRYLPLLYRFPFLFHSNQWNADISGLIAPQNYILHKCRQKLNKLHLLLFLWAILMEHTFRLYYCFLISFVVVLNAIYLWLDTNMPL